MQLHEASAKYHDHRQALDRRHPDDHVWMVERDIHDQGYLLVLSVYVAGLPPPDAEGGWDEARLITRQRGGPRVFKTLDAVASALMQIGQRVLPLDDLPRPDGFL